MKIHRPVITALSVFLALCILTGCAGLLTPKTQDFSAAGMKITLTDKFVEKSYISQTAYFEAPDRIVTVLKEEFSLFRDIGIDPDIYLLTDYAELVISSNVLDAEVVTDDGLTSMTYEQTVSGNDYTYFATVHKGTDAFWLIQFATFTKDFEKLRPDFVTYAKTVTFE